MAAAASPRAMVAGGSSSRPAAIASSTVRIAGLSSYSTTASLAAARAWAGVSAATANSDWPQYSTSPSANIGSSPATGLTSLTPGMSSAVSTRATPGTFRTLDTSNPRMTAWARSLMAM
jgi:hypothetical protein